MSLSIGIVGLPNVGKSTLFNALNRSKQADAQNYPFCTIEPNVGVIEVPDERLAQLSQVSQSKKTIPTTIEFVDIAGLVKGASQGEGLGNKFLSHIRSVDAIVQVVRAFSDNNVVHVHNKVSPKDDAEVIGLELVLADMQTVSKRLENTKKQAKGSALKEMQAELDVLQRLATQLENGRLVRGMEFTDDEAKIVRDLHLLTAKPMFYVVNTDEGQTNNSQGEDFLPDQKKIYISAKLESELADLSPDEATEYLQSLGIKETGLDKLIRVGYELLDLATYFTSGEPETRAWTVKKNTPAPQAAGVIHTDFIKGFIKADVVGWKDFVQYGGWSKIKETGKMRLEGKEYLIQDGDVCYFHIG
ncbi:MAG: redox-regulated ATPase YchF [Candidatus Magasanikbacteria bacterium CG10_big_fil_rev_8_21_14_0_10_40_10]|uniref:Ribosome-binding ATPase YchF n=1 Tax=Candidatus Magasanikbacteria bacterium CG10_big_fil_rev_8_21_14_0_10_40_10 TaxID=1974648 RepID=A0A2M6W4S2_9BACT|nr:MAG: redox-regulated ATPase YchF [Candidatus Magasanikbacteria bacterium CG10_big_fil_rev_8_21_14_0_10_40_10]